MTDSKPVSAYKELRELAGVSLHQAAGVLGISYSRMWSAECGYSRLNPDQERTVVHFYRRRLDERLSRVTKALVEKR